MISMEHHYGATGSLVSTPFWRMGGQHQSGAKGDMASSNNIQTMREAKGWSRPDLAKRMGTSGQQIERLEKGQRRLTQDWIDKAAVAFEVPPTDIIARLEDREEYFATGSSQRVSKKADNPATRSVDAGEAVEIARLNLSLPMGPGATVDDYVEEEAMLFDMAYVRSFTKTPPHRLRLAEGSGDSMFPTLVSNDLVWVDTTQNQLLHSDRIYACSINGGAAIKRLRPIEGGRRVMIISDNKTVEPYAVDSSEVVIWGRVIRFARDL